MPIWLDDDMKTCPLGLDVDIKTSRCQFYMILLDILEDPTLLSNDDVGTLSMK